MKLIKNISQLVINDENNQAYLRGSQMSLLKIIENAAIIFDEKIHWIGKSDDLVAYLSNNNIEIDTTIDAHNKSVISGFVDSHTHIVFGGNRVNEFGRRLRGATYKQIAESGGGISTTVNATRKASKSELLDSATLLVQSAINHGTTCLEIKSGYSLNTKDEIKQLEVIAELKEKFNIEIVSTFMGAHDIPVEFKNEKSKYIDLLCNEMIPEVANTKLAEYCDIFVDEGYFDLEDAKKVFNSALKHNFKLRIHADELVDTNSAKFAAEYNCKSADHLLMINDDGISALAKSETVATLLPGTAYFIRMPYAPARKLIDSNAIVALATDCNPGSSFTENMQMILSLASINMNMTAEECINASTINAAYSLNRSTSLGSISVGKSADFIILDTDNYIDIFYHFGINHAKQVWAKGKRVDSK